MKGRKIWKRLLLTASVFLLAGFSGAYYAWSKVGDQVMEGVQRGYTESLKLNPQILEADRPTVIYDEADEPILTLNRYSQYYRTLDEINPYIKEGFVAVEDKRFYDHHGVDLFATLRAVASTLSGDMQGGSTITQQLARNRILEDADITSNRKLAEMVVAQEMEKQFSKEEILTSYLNTSYFGNGAYGIAAASIRYFGKDQADLTPKEAAVIINLTNNPTLFDPFVYPEETNKKALVTMGQLLSGGVITQEEYDTYLNKTITLDMGELVYDDEFTDNYAVAYALQKAAEQLAVLDGFEVTYWFDSEEDYQAYYDRYNTAIQHKIDRISSGGYDIYTSIDLKTQEDLEHLVREVVKDEPEGLEISTSIVDMNGRVVAMVGGRGFDTYNRAYLSTRQPGSAIKPLLAFAPAFERGLLPEDLVSDREVPGYEYITNWYGSFSNQDVTLKKALVESLNNPAMNLVVDQPAMDLVDRMVDLEFESLHPFDETHVTALGGMTNGVTTIEMASAFSSIANGGSFRSPTNLRRIVDNKNDAVLYDASHRPKRQVYKDYAAYLTADTMKSVVDGPTVHAAVVADNYPKEYQGVKTGTTDENRDAYLVGINSHYAIATWIGNDDNTPLEVDQLRKTFPVNKVVSEYLLKDKDHNDFKRPDSVKKEGKRWVINYEEDVEEEENRPTYAELEDKQRQASEDWNESRIIEEEYRIVYGLSLEEERQREEEVVSALKRLRTMDFDVTDTYPTIQETIASTQALITSVRNQRVKDDLQEELNRLQDDYSARYSELVIQEQDEKDIMNQQRIDAVAEEERARVELQINRLLLDLDQLKYHIESVLQKGESIDGLLLELDELIDELNRLGHASGYYEVLTDGTQVTFIEQEKPELTKEE